jgi:phosphoserine phosphatase RsbU/P
MAAIETAIVDISEDWLTASELQKRSMHLQPRMPKLDHAAKCRQIRELGGDFYDFMPLTESRLAFAIGDACGKGLTAALLVSNVQSSLRTATMFSANDVLTAVEAVNHQVCASSFAGRFVTLFYGVFDTADGTLRYLNAGHNPPLLIHRDGAIDYLETGGAPVGIFPGWCYEQGFTHLNSGDLFVAYTDGVTEAENDAGEFWGVDRLKTAAVCFPERSAEGVVDGLFSAMDGFSRGQAADDATAAVLRVD